MRKAALLLITLAVFSYPIVVTDIDRGEMVIVLTDIGDSLRVETKIPTGFVATDDPNVFETEIDGEKRVVVLQSDTRP
jgi:hypothetical protein